MKEISLTPEPEQKSYWRLIWVITFAIIAIPGIIVLIFSTIAGIIYLVPALAILSFTLYWISLYYKSMRFSITGEAVVVKKGAWWKRETTVPFEKVTNVDKTQGPVERYFKIGKIHVQTAGAGGSQAARAEAIIQGIKNLDEIREEITNRIKFVKGKIAAPSEEDEKALLSQILDEIKEFRTDLKK
jgi:hypothetical protein